MAISKLTTYRSITSHKSIGRGGKKVIKIAVHHMAGNLTVKQCGNVFHNNAVSAHYGVNGSQIGCYVDENDTAWALGVFDKNQRSINIELANDGGASTNWHVSDKTIETTIELIVDIAYRLGWTYIAYDGTYSGSDIIMHRWVAYTACPGPYLASKMRYIATEADKRLKSKRKGKKSYGGTFPKLPLRGYFRKGDKGAQVKNLQRLLNWINRDELSIDGIIGDKTISAVRLAQKRLGLAQDGLFGRATLKACKKYKR